MVYSFSTSLDQMCVNQFNSALTVRHNVLYTVVIGDYLNEAKTDLAITNV